MRSRHRGLVQKEAGALITPRRAGGQRSGALLPKLGNIDLAREKCLTTEDSSNPGPEVLANFGEATSFL